MADNLKQTFNYEIERLDSGYIVNKLDCETFKVNERIALTNADTLETQMNKVIENNLDLKSHLYLKKHSKVKIRLFIEVFE
jgi:hypothetical protein